MAETKPTGAKKHITGARIAQEIKQYKKDALISPLYTVCCVILEILIPYLTASIIDKGIAVGNMAHGAKIGALRAQKNCAPLVGHWDSAFGFPWPSRRESLRRRS